MTLSLTQILKRTEYNDDEQHQFISEHRIDSPPPPPTDYAMDIEEESSTPYSQDVLEMLRLNYSFSSPSVDIVGSAGFVQNLDELSVSGTDKHSICVFLSQIVKKLIISPHLFDLDPGNYSPLEHLFKFADVQRLLKRSFCILLSSINGM